MLGSCSQKREQRKRGAMEQEIRKILRCPICEKGRIADAPAGAALSQYRLFAMVGDEPADIIAKCPRCGMQVGITVRHRTEPPIIVPTLCRDTAWA